GTGVAAQETVPAALAVCSIAPDDPWLACRLAASLGGDCDTVAAIAGAIAGACHGTEVFPARAIEALHAANPSLGVEDLAGGLLSAFGGQHGTGPYGTRIRLDLEREDIATLLAPSEEGDSGFCIVLVEPDGERTFITSPGVESRIGGRQLSSLELAPSDAVFV